MILFMHLIWRRSTCFSITNDLIQQSLYKHCKNIYTVDTTHEEFGFYCLDIFATRIIHTIICPSHHITETSEASLAFATPIISHHFLESFLIQMTWFSPFDMRKRQLKAFLLLCKRLYFRVFTVKFRSCQHGSGY